MKLALALVALAVALRLPPPARFCLLGDYGQPAFAGLSCSSPGWTRTNNPPVNSRMLCQLSYRGTAQRPGIVAVPIPGSASGCTQDGQAGKARLACLVAADESAPRAGCSAN